MPAPEPSKLNCLPHLPPAAYSCYFCPMTFARKLFASTYTRPHLRVCRRLACLFAILLAHADCQPQAGAENETVKAELAKAAAKSKGALVVAITDGTKHSYYCFGKKCPGGSENANPASIFEIGSITKAFTALLLADLERTGKLSFSQPAASHFPEGLELRQSFGKPITLFHLAAHCSGLPRDPDDIDKHNPYGKKNLYSYAARCNQVYRPGTQYLYSNLGYSLLGEVLEYRSGKSLSEFFNETIAEKLGFEDSGFRLDAKKLEHAVCSFDAHGNAIASSSLNSGGASGGLKSSARDLLKFLDFCLSNRKSELKEDLELCLRRRFPIDSFQSSCPGWFFEEKQKTFAKSGQIDGFSTRIEFNPSAKRGIVVLSASVQQDASKLAGRIGKLNKKNQR